MPTEMYVVLPNGLIVPKEFYEAVVEHVKRMIRDLPPGIELTLKEICGQKFWKSLRRGQESMAGRIVSYVVGRGELDMDSIGCKHQLPKRYRRR